MANRMRCWDCDGEYPHGHKPTCKHYVKEPEAGVIRVTRLVNRRYTCIYGLKNKFVTREADSRKEAIALAKAQWEECLQLED